MDEHQYSITSNVVRHDGILDRWRVESLLNTIPDSDIDACYLKHLVQVVTPLYLCNRPPGAAGALITLRDKVVYGWVGPTKFAPSCKVDGCEMDDGHCVRNTHAEVQAIARAAKHGISTDQATMYSVLKPCYNCTKAIIHAGIIKVLYAGAAYDEQRTNDIMRYANVERGLVDIDLEYGDD